MRFNLSLTCVCLMTVLLQYTCSAACMPLEKTRTKNQAPTSSSQSSGECVLLSTEDLDRLRLQIRSKLRSISTQMNETIYDIFRVSATSCECAHRILWVGPGKYELQCRVLLSIVPPSYSVDHHLVSVCILTASSPKEMWIVKMWDNLLLAPFSPANYCSLYMYWDELCILGIKSDCIKQ